jgi:hypothetical protein
VLAAVLLLTHRGTADETPVSTPRLLHGHTAQGFPFVVHTYGSGKPRFAITRLHGTCPGGKPWNVSLEVPLLGSWHVRQRRDLPDELVSLRVDADPATHRGTVSFTDRLKWYRGYTCAAGPVAFSWPR